jgi:hypothetical protein
MAVFGRAHAQAPFASELQAWFKADAGVTLAAERLTEWEDQSGTGFLLTPSGDAPLVTSDALNGLPAVSFDGSTQIQGQIRSMPLSSATIFAVFRYTIDASNNDYLYTLGEDAGAGSQFTLARRSNSRAYHYDGSAQNIGEDGSLPASQWFVSSQVFGARGGVSHDLFLNGSSVLRSTASSPYSADVSTIVVGNWTSGTFRFVGDLVELLVYDRALSEWERTEVEEYLRKRAGLPEFFKSDAEILSDWEVIQYELDGQPDASWTFDLGGTRADQAINADASILLSDIDVANKVIWGEFGAGSAPDCMGFVFGYQYSRAFYLFDW